MGVARVSLGRAAGSTSGCFGQGIREGGGQAATGAQMLTWAAAVRVVTPRPAAGNAGRVLVLRSRCLSRPVTMRRLPRSCRVPWCRAAVMAGGSPTARPRWTGDVETGAGAAVNVLPGLDFLRQVACGRGRDCHEGGTGQAPISRCERKAQGGGFR